MEISFNNKRVLVTGAGKGIGREIVKKLVVCGAKVFALSRSKDSLDTLAEEEPRVVPVCVDLADWDATRLAVEALGPIDALVNNAAVTSLEPFLEVTPESFDWMFNINVKSVINVSQVVAKGMVERKQGGSIVNLSSQAAKAALRNHTIYAGTKGALDIITQVMALELGPHNIRVNCINPTVVLTDMGHAAWSDPHNSVAMLSKIPLGRFAEVEEVVDVVLFILSDHASMVNGIHLPIDGGFLAC